MPVPTNKQFYTQLDTARTGRLKTKRDCASLVLSELLPQLGMTDQMQLPTPQSSETAKSATKLASKIVGSIMPLDDTPVFTFISNTGSLGSPDLQNSLSQVAYDIYRSLVKNNLRDTIYRAILSLIVVGDVLLVMEDVDLYRLVRIDQYVVARDVEGKVCDIGYLTWVKDEDVPPGTIITNSSITSNPYTRLGYKTVFVRVTKKCETNEEGGVTHKWVETMQFEDGTPVDGTGGEYEVSKYLPLRWDFVDGEAYGRSLVENNYGDITALEAATESLKMSLAAASMFWMTKRPGSTIDNNGISQAPSGTWVDGDPNDIGCATPANELSKQIADQLQTVAMYRSSVAEAFLNGTSSIPTGDRVTKAAIDLIREELSALGGPFINVSREIFEAVVSRGIYVMKQRGQLDARLDAYMKDGTLTVSVFTGLQALNKEKTLSRLFQLGQLQSQIPQQAQSRFRWDTFQKAVASNLGFRPEEWYISDEEAAKQEQAKTQNAILQNAAATAANAAAGTAAQAAFTPGQPPQ